MGTGKYGRVDNERIDVWTSLREDVRNMYILTQNACVGEGPMSGRVLRICTRGFYVSGWILRKCPDGFYQVSDGIS